MLRTNNLSVGYDKKVVVSDINIEVKNGEILCLLGSNGAGKTTILRSLSKLITPIRGEIYLNDADINHISRKTLSKKMALVLTNRLLGDLMTVQDVVNMGRYPYTGFFGNLSKKDLIMVDDSLESVNALHLKKRYFDELSDGEKQKVLVARALVQEPEIIILDEPTTHLDIKHRLELMNILKKLSKEKSISVILSLHEIDIALKSCDKVVLVKNNKVIAYGQPEDMVDENMINSLYELEDKNFNSLLGAVEISNKSKNEVFIIGGGGKATPIYRAFTKRGIGIYSGIIHENDIDYEIGRTMGIKLFTEKPFESISDESFDLAIRNLNNSKIIIDTGFSVGETNKRNIDIIKEALKLDKKVYSFRTKNESNKYYKHLSDNIEYVDKVSKIVDSIDKNNLL
ncbi:MULTISPECIES: ABC transporter ATP-binding protein [unclassified Clostridioides]|uniref:ABC transporter ATP-binding protein n=1 Tax=unclassified Clostridioides TaxID=2635829 RepID=UPI001D1127E0|nr:ABC transporter ATP-binding protein [Clostridioides sp. ZZV14-6154]MCC0668979.1 ABC transporter ATP-binding protein [Clostridioides sp. ZZV14-6153]MCC0718205.1 ABC transporter ATP-binding protein [Clostridioides sp. ZZV14-6105]MCC0721546.1 ABC transporter ATP-binding protein [Clostridioides sp. ZZV14-6104]MCC0728147.1 ABC transporter ATP-binding protein [Clostridioides sp. ZZV14-6045]MCC0731946.1 ABC transporter ATP-binding protein [Clostridioides sp. ZZV14-6048]MCC0735618.1 ABC transporte